MSRLRSPWHGLLHRQAPSPRPDAPRKQGPTIKAAGLTLALALLLSASNPVSSVGSVGVARPGDAAPAGGPVPAGAPTRGEAASGSQIPPAAGDRDRVRRLELALAGAEDLLLRVTQERDLLRERLRAMESRLSKVADRQQAARRVELGLRWNVERLENQITLISSRRDTAELWLRDWLLGSVQALEELFDGTGVDVEELVARAVDSEVGQGGPLQVEIDPLPPAADPVALPESRGDDMERLVALQRLARSLPLIAPVDDFELTSGFGRRKDPFTRQPAFHAGLDFGAARGAQVMAAAPGRITYAGPAGEYGNLVEIDHGMGVVTRYAHLKAIEVEVDEAIETRQVIGIIGSTGRSTARHLHYEVRIDDRPHDPARFLEAGRYLVGVFGLDQGTPGDT